MKGNMIFKFQFGRTMNFYLAPIIKNKKKTYQLLSDITISKQSNILKLANQVEYMRFHKGSEVRCFLRFSNFGLASYPCHACNKIDIERNMTIRLTGLIILISVTVLTVIKFFEGLNKLRQIFVDVIFFLLRLLSCQSTILLVL